MRPHTWPDRVIRIRRLDRTPPLPVAIVVAIALSSAATGLGLTVLRSSAFGAISAYILAVAVAALLAGTASGMTGAVLSFLGLNFFFTRPRHTFKVQDPGDVAALFAFLLVAILIGAVLARAVKERHRAERTARELGALNRLALRLLSDEPLGRLFQHAAELLSSLFELDEIGISAEIGADTVTLTYRRSTSAEAAGSNEATPTHLPLTAGELTLGSVTVVRAHPPLVDEERQLMEAFCGQLALAAARARLDTEIRSARLDAETSSLRAALFSSVTHDLRTPLSTIKAGVTSLLDPGVTLEPDQRQDLLRAMLEETDRLNRLVGNLIDLARLRAGALTPTLTVGGVEEIVGSVTARLASLLAPFQVRKMIRPNLPVVELDPVQADQALSNVLENSARYAPPGSEILVAVASFGPWVEVRVADQGPGIPPEERARVLEPFYRRDTKQARGGTGLGLAIANAVMLAHGGRLAIEGAPGGGAAVILRFPIRGLAREDSEARGLRAERSR